ncbi:MAG TPA: hypothetical protein VHV51_14180 [Polyangiaceae bacterium]|nr:hypothetical protein [Polyangiaceae bacterium]
MAAFMVRRGLSRLVPSLVVWSALGCGCASTHFDGRIYQGGEMHFRVGQIPSSWRSIDDDALLAFRDDPANATIALNGRCGVDGDDVPLASLTQHLFLEFTDRDVISQKTLSLDDRDAMRTEIDAALDGVKKHFVVYVLKKNGCVYDFMYIAAPGADSGALAQFDGFVHGFATIE